ncbi:MAG: hypothetical protein FWD74_10590 [Actinomycetia bacterium]|nr:hypothetical protein [Actinomycetes bacterium]
MRRYLFFDGFTWDDVEAAARNLQSRSPWRRSIGSIGTALWLIGMVGGWIFNPSWRTMDVSGRVFWTALTAAMIVCVAFGRLDRFRQLRVDRLLGDT